MSAANARRHLAILLQQGLLQLIDKRPTFERGRPERVFSVSETFLGSNTDLLSSAMLDLLNTNSKTISLKNMRKELAERMAGKMRLISGEKDQPRSQPASLTHRLNGVTRILNHVHYQSRWEAHRDSPRLILSHCPFANIVKENPEICSLDAEILHCLLGQPVQLQSKLVKNPSGVRSCIFIVFQ